MTRILVFFLLILTASAHAGQPGKGAVEVRFLAESVPNDLGKVVLLAEEKRSAAFDLPVNNLSAPQIPPHRNFSVWSVDKNLSLSKITLPEEGKSFTVLLVPSPKGGYSSVVMNSGDPSFKPGNIYFHNHADKTVLGYVGKAKFILAPARGIIVRPAGAQEERFYDVGLGVREKEGDRVLCTMRWPVEKQARVYVFFYLNPQTKRIAFRAVTEFVGNLQAAG